MNYTRKELVEELIQFLHTKKRNHILLVDYIQETQNSIGWTKQRIRTLYGAVHETKAVVFDYSVRMQDSYPKLFIQIHRP